MPVNSAFEGGIHFLTCGFLFGENNSKGKGKGGGGRRREPVDKHLRRLFRLLVIDPAYHLSVRSLSVNQFRARE